MKTISCLLLTLVLIFSTNSWATNSFNNQDNTGSITGTVIGKSGEKLSFASVSIVGTSLRISTDKKGQYFFKNVPAGKVTVSVQFMGYKVKQSEVYVYNRKTSELNFKLEKDVLGIDEVVVTCSRNPKNRQSAVTVVNTISPKLFKSTESITLGESLNFTPGLRLENDCQNCGFTQVRMNGMEGPYSQILINSRPIFSGLAGVYGLELIPSSMIKKIEVVRGGGSALYGSNAIAGTINVILKDPITNTYEVGASTSFAGVGLKNRGKISLDKNLHLNTSLIFDDNRTGMSLYGFLRDRQPFDANNDSFSEILQLKNKSLGARLFHRLGNRSKVIVDFLNIKEKRRGGNKFDLIKHEADIAEAVEHDIFTAGLTFQKFFRKQDLWTVYISGQNVDRKSYYGAEQSLKDYGKTDDFTYNVGTQYDFHFYGHKGEIIGGVEFTSERLKDKKLGYPDIENGKIEKGILKIPHTQSTLVADQKSQILGAFMQYEVILGKVLLSAGLRHDYYKITNYTSSDKSASSHIFSPRLALKYPITSFLQARASYSQGYRAPQIYDEDLHVETSGAKQVVHKNADDLKQETSYSWMGSLGFNKKIQEVFVSFLLEGFYTKLNNPFTTIRSDIDDNGIVTVTRSNATKGANVMGVNMEFTVIPFDKLNFKGGFTLQKSEYKEQQDYENRNFMRTPNTYGYFNINYLPTDDLGISLNGVYTGSMDIPYEGGQAFLNDSEEKLFNSRKDTEGEGGWVVRKSPNFLDLGMKLYYDFHLGGTKVRFFTGCKNILNSYQSDFDKGIDRDPAYLYGPIQPRTIYFGINLGNLL